MSDDRLERYHELVSDVAAFRAACNRPLPSTCWMPEGHRSALEVCPPSGLEPLSWTRNGFRIRAKDRPFGAHFLLGGFLIQEEAAMMAVQAMGLQPGERVLDLCAAPGNKTVHMAEAVGIHGCVVGNDVSAARLQVLRGLVDRFRLPQVLLTVHDGTSFPDRSLESSDVPVRFDAVLVDVPCSCEGTSRKNPSVLRPGSRNRDASLPDTQEALLRRAIRLTRPGGRVLYATCTFAPEENEMVVNRVVSRPGREGSVSIEPFAIQGARLDPGIDHWNGQTLHPSLVGTRRIWPHRNDTGGFFLALLRKEGTVVRDDWPAHPDTKVADSGVLPWSAYAPDEAFHHAFRILPTDRRRNRLVGAATPELPFNVVSAGMSGLSQASRYSRPSSGLAPLLAHHAQAGTADLSQDDILPFLCRQTVDPLELVPPCDRTRYVLVRSGPLALGMGHVDSTGRIDSLFPVNQAGLSVSEWLDGLER